MFNIGMLMNCVKEGFRSKDDIRQRLSKNQRPVYEMVQRARVEMENELTVQMAMSSLPTLSKNESIETFHGFMRPSRRYFIMNGHICYCNHMRNFGGEQSIWIYPYKPFAEAYKLVLNITV